MKGPNRNRKPGRREPFRDPRPTVLVFCEGEKTEKQYLEKFARYHKNALMKLEVAKETGVPFSLVKFASQYKREIEKNARRQKDQNIAFDSVWCVFDIDDHPRVSDAKEMAAANGIRLAISNPCFELWLVLHLTDSPGMQHRDNVQSLLESLDSNYDKDVKQVDFPRYVHGYKQAVTRATRLDALALSVGTPGHNPTTNVYELTELILSGGKGE
ncbi:RloB family protein [Schlesneria sp. T3-172]|uniref:RloB family protein n=1 Tax=Schlesneria sphaerica TaxID=3373610 RepID=UPI0037CC8683